MSDITQVDKAKLITLQDRKLKILTSKEHNDDLKVQARAVLGLIDAILRGEYA